MAEINIKVDVPKELKAKFESVLARALDEFVNKLELTMAKEIVSDSKLTEEEAEELSEKVKSSMHKNLKEKGLA